jgi:hypothetical protein
MSRTSFSLKPFMSFTTPDPVKISGTIERRANTLSLTYSLLAPLPEVLIPVLADSPVRRNVLWEETCFEFFLGLRNADGYWEFNLSPSRHWNVYRFSAYRQGMQEEPAFTSLPFRVETSPGMLGLSLNVNLDKIAPEGQSLQAGISAVIKAVKGGSTYWALTHPGPQPDFHCRESFVIEL